MKKFKIVAKVIVIILLVAFFAYKIAVRISESTLESFPVKGVDVSSYQGKIDWETLAGQGVDFAFVKATEGSTYKDRLYSENIKNAKETDIALGAYHFMSFESDGKTQAENFISSVKKEDIVLPPVIDLELYGDYTIKPPSASDVRKILDELVSELYKEYGKYPIIYTNRRAYLLYVSGEYAKCDLWMCDIIKRPSLPDGREWKFWQYSHTGKLEGYSGEEEYIDLNVFGGDEREFKEYLRREE